MKRTISFILAVMMALSCAFLSGCASKEAGDQLETIKSRGKIIVAMEGVWAPWTYHNTDGDLVGFDTEVAKAIAEKLGVEAEFKEGDFDALFVGFEQGDYDIIVNEVEITESRSAMYDFTEPYAYIHTALIVRGDNEDIKSFADLAGRTTANSNGSTYAAMAEEYGATVLTVPTLEETLSMVLDGRAEATLNADQSFYDFMDQHPEANLKIVDLTEEASFVAIPIRKGDESASLNAAISKAIRELREDGTLRAISEKYLGMDITSDN